MTIVFRNGLPISLFLFQYLSNRSIGTQLQKVKIRNNPIRSMNQLSHGPFFGPFLISQRSPSTVCVLARRLHGVVMCHFASPLNTSKRYSPRSSDENCSSMTEAMTIRTINPLSGIATNSLIFSSIIVALAGSNPFFPTRYR